MPAKKISIDKNSISIKNNGKLNEIGKVLEAWQAERDSGKDKNLANDEKPSFDNLISAFDNVRVSIKSIDAQHDVDYLLSSEFDLYPNETICVVLTGWGNSVDRPIIRPSVYIELTYYTDWRLRKNKVKRDVIYTRGSDLKVLAETGVDMSDVQSSLDNMTEILGWMHDEMCKLENTSWVDVDFDKIEENLKNIDNSIKSLHINRHK